MSCKIDNCESDRSVLSLQKVREQRDEITLTGDIDIYEEDEQKV